MPATRLNYFHPRHGLVKVKRGFCWPAFFLGSLWAVVKRLWFPAFACFLAFDLALWFLTGYAGAQHADGLAVLDLLATVLCAFVRGKYANRWQEASLVRKGYKVMGSASASS